ncbi:MAG: hypothetical protein AAF684_04725 [Pseudomonadota bacterium]
MTKIRSVLAVAFVLAFVAPTFFPDAAAHSCRHGGFFYVPGKKLKLYGVDHICSGAGLWKIVRGGDYDKSQTCRVGDEEFGFGETICRNGTRVFCGANGQSGPIYGTKCLSWW